MKIEDYDSDKNSEELNNLKTEDSPTKDFMYFIFDLLKTGVIVFVIAFSLRYFAIQPFVVDGESMMPNYVNNEYILAEKVSYLAGEPKRGDVIIFKYPGNPSVSYIKRIIGLPGETVEIKENRVTVYNNEKPNGFVLNEKYIPETTLTYAVETGDFKKTIGQDEYFVMGDNRQHSSDSREWGLLPRENIIGRSWLTLLPFDKFGINKRISYSGILTTFLPSLSVSRN